MNILHFKRCYLIAFPKGWHTQQSHWQCLKWLCSLHEINRPFNGPVRLMWPCCFLFLLFQNGAIDCEWCAPPLLTSKNQGDAAQGKGPAQPAPLTALWAPPVCSHGTTYFHCFVSDRNISSPFSKHKSKNANQTAASGTNHLTQEMGRWLRPRLQLTLFFSLMISKVYKTRLNHVHLRLCGLTAAHRQLLIEWDLASKCWAVW